MGGETFEKRLAEAAQAFETYFETVFLDSNPLLRNGPDRLLAAMRHGALGGGKRLRPFLVLESARLFGAGTDDALTVAAALECVHCYSLIHDDLPAMDDDDLRRGRPTVHRAFDEATAILAGDSLLTLAFGTIAARQQLAPEARLALVELLSRDAGAGGMAGGQALDLDAEEADDLGEAAISRMQAMKTGALIAYACQAGAILAGAPLADAKRLRRYGEIVGLAFQLADDLLDETADAATLGKAAGKDRARGKKTLPALHGQDWTRRRLDDLVTEAGKVLEPYGERGRVLIDAARFVAERIR